MLNIYKKIALLLVQSVGLLNFFGGIIGAVGLIFFNHNFSLVVVTLFITIISTNLLLSIILFPIDVLFCTPASVLMEKKKYMKAYGFLAMSWIYNYLIMMIWVVGAFLLITGHHTAGSIVPYLLFAYSTATSPWTYMAIKSRTDNLFILFMCTGPIAITIFEFITKPTTISLVILFIIFTVIPSFVVQSQLYFASIKK